MNNLVDLTLEEHSRQVIDLTLETIDLVPGIPRQASTTPFPMNFNNTLPFSGGAFVETQEQWPTTLETTLLNTRLVLDNTDAKRLEQQFLRDVRQALAFRFTRSNSSTRCHLVHCLPSLYETFIWRRLDNAERSIIRRQLVASLFSQRRIVSFFGRSSLVRTFKSQDWAFIAPRCFALTDFPGLGPNWLSFQGGEYLAVLEELPNDRLLCFQATPEARTFLLGHHVLGRIGLVPRNMVLIKEPFKIAFNSAKSVAKFTYNIWRFNPGGSLQNGGVCWDYMDYDCGSD